MARQLWADLRPHVEAAQRRGQVISMGGHRCTRGSFALLCRCSMPGGWPRHSREVLFVSTSSYRHFLALARYLSGLSASQNLSFLGVLQPSTPLGSSPWLSTVCVKQHLPPTALHPGWDRAAWSARCCSAGGAGARRIWRSYAPLQQYLPSALSLAVTPQPGRRAGAGAGGAGAA